MIIYNLWLELIFIGIYGACWGSFCANMIYRISNDKSLVKPSNCPHCQNAIQLNHLIPIISYLYLQAKCSNCQKPISRFYPLIELAGVIITIIIYLNSNSIFFFLIFHTFWSLLLVNSYLDFTKRWFYSYLLLINIFLGLIICFYFTADKAIIQIISAFSIAGGLYYLRFIYSLLRNKEMLGEGDISLSGILALVFSWQVMLYILFIASFSGVIIILLLSLLKKTKLNMQFPLGGWLIMISFVAWIYRYFLEYLVFF